MAYGVRAICKYQLYSFSSLVKQYETSTSSRLMMQTIKAALKASGPREASG